MRPRRRDRRQKRLLQVVAFPARRETRAIRVRQAHRDRKGIREPQARQAHRGQKVTKAIRGWLDQQVRQVRRGRKATKVIRAWLDQQVRRGHRDRRETLEPPGKEQNCLLLPIHGLRHKLLMVVLMAI